MQSKHTFPNHRSLSGLLERGVRHLREGIQSLQEGLAGRVQGCLRFRVLRVTVGVDLVAAGAEHRGGKHLGHGDEQIRCKLSGHF